MAANPPYILVRPLERMGAIFSADAEGRVKAQHFAKELRDRKVEVDIVLVTETDLEE